MDRIHINPEQAKHVGDLASVGILAGTWWEMLPNFAAALTIVWTLFRILEMLTGKKMHELVQCVMGRFKR